MPSVFIPIRSEHEDTRVGESDLAGGKLKIDSEDDLPLPEDAIKRGSNTRGGRRDWGLALKHLTLIATVDKVKDGVPTTTHILGGIAIVGEDGFTYGKNENGQYEHSDGAWHPIPEVETIPDLPKKYRTNSATEMGSLILDVLGILAEEVPDITPIPVEELAQAA